MSWTDSQKEQVIEAYKAAKPDATNSVEIVKQIAEDIGQSPNGVRMILDAAGVYIKKVATSSATAKTADGKPKATRVSKESQIQELKDAITEAGATVDDEVLDKLTGKAAAYLLSVLNTVSLGSKE